MLVLLDELALVLLDDQVPIFANPFFGHLFDADVLIFFGMKKNLLAAFFVLEAELIEALATLAAVGLDGGHGSLVRERVGRLGFAIVDRAGDNRPVGVAFEKLNDDLLADTRQKD